MRHTHLIEVEGIQMLRIGGLLGVFGAIIAAIDSHSGARHSGGRLKTAVIVNYTAIRRPLILFKVKSSAGTWVHASTRSSGCHLGSRWHPLAALK